MAKMNKIENRPNFPQVEKNINEFWKKNNIFEKSVESKDDKDRYVFEDGPPFVSGLPHYGHLITSIAKDVVPRYWTMKGKKVRRVFGWDCHGLPIEEKINKKFNLTGKKQIDEEFGVDRYVEECRSFVEQCTTDWRDYIEKIGRWVDLDNAYYTMHPEFNESVIWGFKKIWEKGYIYKGKRTSMYSTDTCTPVSQFEVAMDPSNYRDVEDLSIFVKFKVSKSDAKLEFPKDTYFVAWTTTPWTIPSNFGLAVNPTADYCLVEFEGENYVVAKQRLEYTFDTTKENIGKESDKLVKVLKEYKGTEFDGVEYENIYDFFKGQNTASDWKVYLYEGVTIEDGSGVLHLAPAFGEEDFNLGKNFGLSGYEDIDDEGKLIVGDWKGTYLRDANPLVAEDLQKKGNLLRSMEFTHSLPFYRGENPLIYRTQDAYFIDIQKLKTRMLELNQDINWIPEHIKNGRFAQTLETSPDWCISRNRYWATIMPLWKSDDGDELVIGSFEEMMSYTDQITKKEENGKVSYYLGDKKMTLHRDSCDKVILKKDGKEYRRVPEVMDCWLDSGSVPFAEYHYPFENKETFDKAFPADFIVEYTPQVRAWFNVLLRVSTLVFDKVPFKNAICHGTLAGNDGRKMSKSFGNYPDPKDVLDNIGGEAVRLYLMGSPIMVGGDMDWSDEALNEQVKNVLLPIWNVYKYLGIYADLHNWNPENTKYSSTNALDKWLEEYMNKVTKEYAVALENYNIPESVKLVQPAVDNISSWWIRRSRDRFAEGDKEAMQTLYAALVQFIKTFAPQMPFLSEEIYQNIVVNTGIKEAKESVHLEDFPSYKDVNEDILNQMELVRQVSTTGLNIRVKNGIKLKQPLSKAFIASDKVKITDKDLLDIVKDELNVKDIEMVEKIEEKENLLVNTSEGISVAIDTFLTDELKDEGLLNEITRQIQNLRKESGFKMGEPAVVIVESSKEVMSVVEKYMDVLKKSVSADSIKEGSVESKSLKVGDYQIKLSLQKA